MRIRSLFLGGLALVASLSAALAQVNTVPQVGVITSFNTQKQTYSAASSFSAAASATDIATICGSATKTIRVQSITVTGQTTGSAVVSIVDIVKRSTRNTGGTATQLTAVPLDSNNATATALVDIYTGNPTVGTLVGTTSVQALLFGLTSTAVSVVPALFNYNAPNLLSQPMVLRGAAQCASVSLNGASANVTAQVTVNWSEE